MGAARGAEEDRFRLVVRMMSRQDQVCPQATPEPFEGPIPELSRGLLEAQPMPPAMGLRPNPDRDTGKVPRPGCGPHERFVGVRVAAAQSVMNVGQDHPQAPLRSDSAHRVGQDHRVASSAHRHKHTTAGGQELPEGGVHVVKDRVARGPHGREQENKKTLTAGGQGAEQHNVPKKGPKDKAGCLSRQNEVL
jgi:hypothetical protein